MNKTMKIKAYSMRVGEETEGFFNDYFYESLSGICNALDNVEARLYMDAQVTITNPVACYSDTI